MIDLDYILLLQYLIIPIIFFKYGENKDRTKAFLSLLLLILFLKLTNSAECTRLTYDATKNHFILAIISLLTFIFIIIKDKYYWSLIFLSVVYTGIYLILYIIFDELLPPIIYSPI